MLHSKQNEMNKAAVNTRVIMGARPDHNALKTRSHSVSVWRHVLGGVIFFCVHVSLAFEGFRNTEKKKAVGTRKRLLNSCLSVF